MENQKSVQVERYKAEAKQAWDNVLEKCVNGSFLLRRSYMEYHKERFEDFSYMIWYDGVLVGVFAAAVPVNKLDGGVLIAHPGLTYGGLAHVSGVKYPVLEEVYTQLISKIKEDGFNKLVIKYIPQVFCNVSNDAGLFYFYKNNFQLSNRELNSVIDLTQSLTVSKGRKDNIRKARNKGVVVLKDNSNESYEKFWDVLTRNLMRTHGTKPVHSLDEIIMLYNLHPNNISLYTAMVDQRVVAGVLVFYDINRGFMHTQYISASEEGKSVGAVDVVLMDIVLEAQTQFRRFSFGTSTLSGNVNYGLLSQKEGFGSNAEVIDTYTIEL